MTAVDPAVVSALDPVRAALLAAARQEAEQSMAEATAAAGRTQAQAVAEAARITADARARGTADADAYLATQQARASAEARMSVLRAEREAYDQLVIAARTAVAALREDPGYPRLRDRLAAAARAVVGPDASIQDAPRGGIVGVAADRRIDLSLHALADRAVAAIIPDADLGGAP